MHADLGYTQLLIDTCRLHELTKPQAAYVLATAYHETAHTMRPVAEAFFVPNPDEWRKKNLRYYPWYGRGFVQLTWETNYKRASEELGVDVVADPDKAMDPGVSALTTVVGMLEGWFTGKKLSDYINDTKTDYRQARRIVNGMDKASLIAGHAKHYEQLLEAIEYGTPAKPPILQPRTVPAAPDGLEKPMHKSKTMWAGVAAFASSAVSGLAAMPWQTQVVLVLIAAAAIGFMIYERRRYASEARQILQALS